MSWNKDNLIGQKGKRNNNDSNNGKGDVDSTCNRKILFDTTVNVSQKNWFNSLIKNLSFICI